MIKNLILILLCIFELRLTAQFNNVYLEDEGIIGTAIGIKENSFTGEYVIPIGYSNGGPNASQGFLKINQNGTLTELKHNSDLGPNEFFYIWNRGFFKTEDGGYVLAGNGAGPDITRLDENLDVIWEVDDIQDTELQA